MTPLAWTREIGYLYPEQLFRAAIVGTFPGLAEWELEICRGEYETVNGAWNARVERQHS